MTFIGFYKNLIKISSDNHQKWSKMIKNKNSKIFTLIKFCDNLIQKINFWCQFGLKSCKTLFLHDFHRCYKNLIKYISENYQKLSKMIKNDQKWSKIVKTCDNVVQKINFWPQISLKLWKSHFFDGFHRYLCLFDH